MVADWNGLNVPRESVPVEVLSCIEVAVIPVLFLHVLAFESSDFPSFVLPGD